MRLSLTLFLAMKSTLIRLGSGQSMPQTHYQEWKRLLEILPSTSVGAALRNRAEALEQAKRKLQAQFEDIRDAWVAGGETTQRDQAWLGGTDR